MSVIRRRLRTVAVAALAAGVALGSTACSKSDNEGSTGEGGQVKLVLQTFSNFGYDQAIKDFEAANPNIKVEHQKMGELRDFQPKLVQWLAAGSGAGDVVGLEEGVLLGYVQNHDKFANLLDLGASDLKSGFPEWKWNNALTPDGKKLIGLGTDVGGLAMCYRKDLFQQAGLPTDRTEVSKRMSTWQDYIALGKEFKASGKAKAAWLDSATSLMQPHVMQNSETFFFDKDNKFIGETNPIVKQTWDMGLQMAADGLTAKAQRWSADWDAAFKNSAFATIPCPSWMTEGVIAPKSGPANSGKWDIANIPGGGGNWGGSYLAVPAQTKHPKEAYLLAKYLTSKEGHLAAFKEAGAMPSDIAGIEDPAFKDKKSEYFSGAPTGQIFGDSVKNMKPVFLGAKHQQIWETVVEPQMQAAERGQVSSDAGWKKAMDEAKKLTS
ncbi:extracellular solute-binding protein [Plantactinospora endophytica]|uniref:Sugar ABC transporter substrate-binding protein n=1 Tax=Plantactinospora endophytica TaxID=673535 RepID=A0ABQ4DWQ2_9ACTN|nr:extracellular solute-binding protein [Plantactinospora endophytica]GIG86873.1 sugar ABC transporter substrate-binding protein [Plantactinospora endophytica]